MRHLLWRGSPAIVFIADKMRFLRGVLYIVVFFIGLTSCGKHNEEAIPSPSHSVYYWKTIFRLDRAETEFLKRKSIRKIYLRYFDVDYNESGLPVPVGTVQFDSKVPRGIKVIPVVYIENHCLGNVDGLADKIVKRVLTMSFANDIVTDELQIDCDWTDGSRQKYFDMLGQIRKLLNVQGHYIVSATIRLHQLEQSVPPVDYGVLMCYNTGNLRDYQSENSVLSVKDVLPFVNSHFENYPLSLCAAYPLFGWNLLFEHGQFKTILRDINLSDASLYKKVSDKRYVVIRSHTVPSPDPNSFGMMVRAGDEIKVDEVPYLTIRKVQSILENKRPDIDRQVVLFSLNSINKNKITNYEMDKIYSH
jgi:hypothetical protein